jgi:hypothetical protein
MEISYMVIIFFLAFLVLMKKIKLIVNIHARPGHHDFGIMNPSSLTMVYLF